MNITKRTGHVEPYRREKISRVIELAFASVDSPLTNEDRDAMTQAIEEELLKEKGAGQSLHVEDIQDLVEKTLIERNYYKEVKSFILYREDRKQKRRVRNRIAGDFVEIEGFEQALKEIQRDFPDPPYGLDYLDMKFRSFYKEGMTLADRLHFLTKAAVELATSEAPRWEFIAARIYFIDFDRQLVQRMKGFGVDSFYEKLEYLTDQGLYGSYILQQYSREEIEKAYSFIDNSRNKYINYSGLDLLIKRYVIRTHSGDPVESVQEMFLGIALHLAMNEAPAVRLDWVRRFYDMLSQLQVTMATPTMANARKPHHQLSSCFIDTVPDSLDGIYRSIDNFAKVSKFGGGMGLYFGKVRARGSSIRGFEGAAGGVIRWIRLANDTAVAVDQLGVRQGAVAVYLDVWHKDLPEFLGLRTNNGDDRLKAHDVFPAVCYPDYFWQQARDNIEGDWYLMCPHEIQSVKGYALEDCYGDEWREKYLDCVADHRISKRVLPIKEIIRLIIKSSVETGTPFAFNRDTVNAANPNKHKGMIYCSNLCTEIAQNMSAISLQDQRIETIDGEDVVVTVTRPGEFVVCNLASLSLGHINVDDDAALQTVTESAVRALDNIIDLNFFPLPYAKLNNRKYRPVGLGVSGYHHMLAKHQIAWESDAHLSFVDDVFERINYAAVAASAKIAEEKGAYSYFEGSDWQTGDYFSQRGYTSDRWQALAAKVAQTGMRNGYLMAIAPTSSTSIIAATSPGVDPIMNRFFLEEKKDGLMPRVAPELSDATFWFYKSAHLLDQTYSVKASGIRQRHIDQAQSMNLYITNDYTFRKVLNLYILAWECGVKTIYYIRSKSLEVEECEACSS
ncbi:ribonucleoside-diphosphate reductase subunit alpha [Peptococcus simiae]|uniref:ribonucleoside-diphosphate reductase subunit alpha n=1 Tax=Peptococcus simiae TaxID=1643805 RepID=UPI003980695B